MEVKEIDKAVLDIVEKKVELSKLNYSDKRYDAVEEELHDLEDEFIDNYGDYFEGILKRIHQSYCPGNEVLLPTAYFGNEYKLQRKTDGTTEYDVDYNEGVVVESEKFPSKVARLVILPNPVRILFQSQVENQREEAWNIAKQADVV